MKADVERHLASHDLGGIAKRAFERLRDDMADAHQRRFL